MPFAFILVAAAGLLLTLGAATRPASAQLGFYVGEDGAVVRLGEPRLRPRYVVEEEIIARPVRPRCRVVERERRRGDGTIVRRIIRECP
jgi:hypothetical protein